MPRSLQSTLELLEHAVCTRLTSKYHHGYCWALITLYGRPVRLSQRQKKKVKRNGSMRERKTKNGAGVKPLKRTRGQSARECAMLNNSTEGPKGQVIMDPDFRPLRYPKDIRGSVLMCARLSPQPLPHPAAPSRALSAHPRSRTLSAPPLWKPHSHRTLLEASLMFRVRLVSGRTRC